MSIDRRDNNAPWNQEELPPLTEIEKLEEEVSNLRNKIKGMIKKSEIEKILKYYGDENPRTQVIKLKQLLEL